MVIEISKKLDSVYPCPHPRQGPCKYEVAQLLSQLEVGIPQVGSKAELLILNKWRPNAQQQLAGISWCQFNVVMRSTQMLTCVDLSQIRVNQYQLPNYPAKIKLTLGNEFQFSSTWGTVTVQGKVQPSVNTLLEEFEWQRALFANPAPNKLLGKPSPIHTPFNVREFWGQS